MEAILLIAQSTRGLIEILEEYNRPPILEVFYATLLLYGIQIPPDRGCTGMSSVDKQFEQHYTIQL